MWLQLYHDAILFAADRGMMQRQKLQLHTLQQQQQLQRQQHLLGKERIQQQQQKKQLQTHMQVGFSQSYFGCQNDNSAMHMSSAACWSLNIA